MKTLLIGLLWPFILLTASSVLAQDVTQTLRGRVLDQAAKTPLAGVNVVVTDVLPLAVGVSDADGYFRIEHVALGRHTVQCSLVGYQAQQLPNVLITSGKEAELTIDLIEALNTLNAVVVRSATARTAVEKGLSSVSGQVFDIEQTQRFAGSRNDPARMVASLAGVQGNNDTRNDIIIRGNSPTGVLWRLEGVDIFNPSHFGELGATGGPVSMINNSLLAKSSFLTGAFPAVYGNATAGVFDLQLRAGNSAKPEYTAQAGINGLELGVEGPFSPQSRASYVVNYRYSALALASKLGVSFGTGSGIPAYQDLSGKISLPTRRAGTFSVFWLGGSSAIRFRNDQTGNAYNGADQNLDYATSMGIIGISNTHTFGPGTTGRLTMAVSEATARMVADNVRRTADGTPLVLPNYRDNSRQSRATFSYVVNHKHSPQTALVTGLTVNQLGTQYQDSLATNGQFKPLRNVDGQATLMQVYGNWQHRPSDRLTLNVGVFGQHFFLNQTTALEPRAGLRYQLSPRQTISVGLGRHSQLQSLPVYFSTPQPGDVRMNRALDFTRSEQAVLGYQRLLGTQTTLRIETYYQYLHGIPVDFITSSYSAINLGAAYEVSTQTNLINVGTATNKGIELTLERTFANRFYYLLTGSLYDSRYRGSDQQDRPTAFAGRYAATLLAGRELPLGHRYTLAVDVRLAVAGGRRYTPIDEVASGQQGKEVLVDAAAYSRQNPNYFRADTKLTLRRNGNRFMHELALDVQNVTNHQNLFRQSYDVGSNQIKAIYQLGFYPLVNYRVQF